VKRVTLRAALLLGSVFVCGALVGGAGVKVWMQRKVIDDLTAGPGRRFTRHSLRHFADQLNLTADQRDRVIRILEAHRPEMERIREQLSQSCAQPLREHKRKIEGEIRAVLTPEQRERFNALMAKQHRRFPPMGPPPWRSGHGRGHRSWRGGQGHPTAPPGP
jgi:Spy/CpxP family protein refolding chaperone